MPDLPKVISEFSKRLLPVGDFVKKEWETFSRDHVESKGRNDLVSYVDRESEQRLVAICKDLIPASGFILEEGGEQDIDREWRWIIDPLDGTTNFIHGLPAFAISVALQRNEETLAGWILEIPALRLYSAIKGNGAFANGNKISVSPEKRIAHSLLATGFPYSKNNLPPAYLDVLAQFVKNSHGVRRYGSAAIDLAWVAEGRFEGFYEIGLKAWDVAAGSLIVKEAGGTITDFSGGENYMFGRQMLASNTAIHGDMLRILSPFEGLMKG